MSDTFYSAVMAFRNDRFVEAADLAREAAAEHPTSQLYREAARYLARVASEGKAGVYVSGEAFAAFIRGGGNLPLYAATSTALRAVYAEYPAGLSLLDVGVGDGMALLPAIDAHVQRLDLVEPSAAMLAQTCSALDARGIAYRAFAGSLQDFAASAGEHWDLIEATFSLQSLQPPERPVMLAWLRAHADRLLIAEFDVPHFASDEDPARLAHFVARYERGLNEYADDNSLVAQGFLMPIFFGYFDHSSARTNYEQPLDAWEQELRAAGFGTVERRPLYDYWWAPAYLINAL